MENNYYIYFHINLVSNEVFYVGKGKDKRAWSKFGRSDYWKRIVNKYGYRVDIIHENLSEKRAFDFEKLYISMFGRKNLVNHTDGGEGGSGYKHTEESKEKLKKPKSDKTKQKMSDSRKNRIITEETKKKLSESGKGRIQTEETRKKCSEVRKLYWQNKKNELQLITE